MIDVDKLELNKNDIIVITVGTNTSKEEVERFA